MAGCQVIAIRHQQYGGQSRDPTYEVMQDVECGFISPVDIVDRQHSREVPTTELRPQGDKQLLSIGVPSDSRSQIRADIALDVVERRESPTPCQVVAAPHQHAASRWYPASCFVDHGRSSDPGLTRNQNYTASTRSGRSGCMTDSRQLSLPLKHRPIRFPDHASDTEHAYQRFKEA
ncbi:hypothetical protein GCM10029976_094320 [Kribbella albertanoniae]